MLYIKEYSKITKSIIINRNNYLPAFMSALSVVLKLS